MFDWGDLRPFLAVARMGTTAAAGEALKLSATTIARRISALEEALGLVLFERAQVGYRLTERGERLREIAEKVERELISVDQLVAAGSRSLSGSICVTAPETLATAVLLPRVAEFRKVYPEISIDFHADDRPFDLARGEADVAFRAGTCPSDPALVVRKLCDLGWAVYCGADYAHERGVPRSTRDLDGHVLIGAAAALAGLPGPRWLARHAPEAEVSHQSNSVTSLLHATLANFGLATLPCVIADREPKLVRCFGPVLEIKSELWLATHERLRHVSRIRAFMDFMAAHIANMRRPLTGE